MPTLAAGSSTSITLAAGQELYFTASGAGTAVIASGQQAGQSYQIGNSRQQIGPFTQAVQVSISATAALAYYVLGQNPATEPPSEPVVQDPGTGQQYSGGSLVSGAGKRAQAPYKLWGQIQTSTGALGNTLHATYEVPFDWIAVRVYEENMTALARPNTLTSVAVSNDGTAAPTVPSGAWTPVLFSGVASHSIPAAASGAGTNEAVPGVITSDWLALPSIPRTDGGTGRVLMVRQYAPQPGSDLGNRCDIASAALSLAITKVKGYWKSGDFVTTPAGFTTPSEWSMVPAVWFEFLTASGAVVLLACGDSTVQGSDGGPMPNVAGAARLASESLYGSVALANEGWASQTSTAYYANALAKLAAIKPSIAFYCPWSPNDTDKYTSAGITRMQQQALQWIEACRVVGTKPVLLTPCPANGLNSTQEGFRRQIVNWVKATCAAGLATLADRDAVYTDYSTDIGGFKAGLNATTLHPNATGYALEAAQVWQPLLR